MPTEESVMRRVAPAIFLFFLSPFVAEYLLGDFPITYLPLIVVLAPMYGGGALVIREVVRRTGRGWPSIVLLALAYGVLEEGATTMSLFNPDYVDAHLLDQGFVPALGIAIPWTIYVLALHTIWSISVPIAVVEEWTPRRTTPWLRTPGFVIGCLLLALGCFGTTMSTYGNEHYIAAWPKLLAVGIIVVVLVVAAFVLPRRTASRPAPGAPSPWLVLAATLVAGLLFMLTKWGPIWLGVTQMIVALAGITIAIAVWSRRAGWGSPHRLAAAAGGLFTYAWHSFTTHPLVGDQAVVTPVSHVLFALGAVALVWYELRSLRSRAGEPEGVHGPPAQLDV
jgi:hypothetical protein